MPRTDLDTAQINVTIGADQADALRELAHRRRTTISQLVREALDTAFFSPPALYKPQQNAVEPNS